MMILNENASIFGPGYHEAVEKACAVSPSEEGVSIGAIKLELVAASGGSGRAPKPTLDI